jgi:hypothetical protein
LGKKLRLKSSPRANSAAAPASFDLVGEREQRWRHGEAERAQARCRIAPLAVKLAFPRGNAYPLGLEKEAMMDTTTLLIIVIILVIVLGGGWYGRGRWF